MTIGEHLRRVFRRGLRELFDVFCGYSVLTPQQERLIEMLENERRVAVAGGSGVGKSFVLGTAAAIVVASTPGMKALFGAPKLEQAVKLSWLHLQNAILRARERGWEFAPDGITEREWYPVGQKKNPGWYACCMALSDRNNAASVKGMLHGERVLVVLDEMEGIAPEVRDALLAGTSQENAHFWFSFNPVSRTDAAGEFWSQTPENARIQISALDTARWMSERGVSIPGVPTLASIQENWAGKEHTPGYYTYVLGEFPPQDAAEVVIPASWFDALTGVSPSSGLTALGVDTAAGGDETVIAAIVNGVVSIPWASRAVHQTADVVAAVKNVVVRLGLPRDVPIAVDYIGTGGKGVYDLLRLDGYNAIQFVGGGKKFLGHSDPTGLTADCATWAWMEVRSLVEKSRAQGVPLISFPADPELRRQFERPFRVSQEREYKLADKSDLDSSPDRADAVAMAVLGALVSRRVGASGKIYAGVVV